MRILFIGTVAFSYKVLEKLINLNADIVGVCTKETSSFNSDFVDLTPLCVENNIPYKYIVDINSNESLEWIKNFKPEVIFCFGWSCLIKKNLLQLAPKGIVGYHPSKLPQNRGRHPLIWALVLGLKKSASTFFFMKEGADDGDILSQEDFDIHYHDDANSLYHKLIDIAQNQITNFLPQLQNNNYPKTPQEHTNANSWRKRGKEDGKIDFRMSSEAIYNLVRALTKPYPGSYVTYKGKDVLIWESKVMYVNLPNIEYGKVIESREDFVIIKCMDQAIKFSKHEFKELPKKGEYL